MDVFGSGAGPASVVTNTRSWAGFCLRVPLAVGSQRLRALCKNTVDFVASDKRTGKQKQSTLKL